MNTFFKGKKLLVVGGTSGMVSPWHAWYWKRAAVWC